MSGSMPLGEVLIQERLISREILQTALGRQQETGRPLGKVLLEMGVVTEEQLVEAVSRQLGVPFVDVKTNPPQPAIVRMISQEMAERLTAVPAYIEDDHLVIAMVEPTNTAALREIAEATGYACRAALGVRHRIAEVIAGAFPAPDQTLDPVSDVMQPIAVVAPAVSESEPKELSMHDLLNRVIDDGASDLHLTVSGPPVIRVRGSLRRLEDYPILQPAELRKLVYSILTQRQREHLEEHLELDLAYSLPGRARFRMNVFFQRDAIAAAIRLIPFEIKSLQQLEVPMKAADFAYLPRGLVLVTGPTGSGKSTTLAAIVDIVNKERSDHILTVEDPIEFLHHHQKAVVNQREVGTDTRGFAAALKSALRQDPDVILVGEMRDLETIATALTAAETGHLVFGTLHTQSAPEAVDRVIDVFPPHQQQQVRVQLAATLQGVITQQLLPTADGLSRAIACEIMIATPAIRNMVREGKTHMIYSSMQAGGAHGMITMDQSLAALVRDRRITFELGLERCHNAEDYTKLSGRV